MPFALFCGLLRTCFCALFCERPRLERPHLGTPDKRLPIVRFPVRSRDVRDIYAFDHGLSRLKMERCREAFDELWVHDSDAELEEDLSFF